MKKKKIIASFLCLALLIISVFSISASAGFGSGVAVVAAETKIIKTGIFGQKIIFSDLDFKQGLAITDFDKIEICDVPSSEEGTLLLAGRKVKPGTVIKRKNIGALVFVPASKNLAECKFSFTTEDFAEGAVVDFIIKFTDKVNYAPTIDESVSASVSTQREISVFGQMSAYDKEGDEVEFFVVSYPKSGTLKTDKNGGEYVYTPTEGFCGTDSFSYVARDEWGNYSKVCKVKIDISERLSEVVYVDMESSPSYNAALTLTAMGIMDGRLIGDGSYFMPEETVSRAEFLVMAMKSAGISPDKNAEQTYFDDNSEISKAHLPYVKAAARLGIINGEFKGGRLIFRPNDAITKAEAAMIISKLVNTAEASVTVTFSDSATVPVYIRDDMKALVSMGIINCDGDKVNGNTAVTKADAADYLYNMMKHI